MSARKQNKAVSPQAEAEAARLFGKHVSKTKGRLLLAVTRAARTTPCPGGRWCSSCRG